MEKTCSRCGETKPADQFVKNSRTRDGLRSSCKACDAERYRRWRDEDPERAREAWRRASSRYADRGFYRWKKYGLTQEDYLALAEQQQWRCLICQCPTEELVVDHCHVTGRVRALLCSPCNTGLGMFGEDLERLEAAIRYLRTVGVTDFTAGSRSRQPSPRVNARTGAGGPRCQDCGGECSAHALRCRPCHVLHQYAGRMTKIEWPPLSDLVAMVDATSYLAVGRKLGVTDNAVRKHIRTERRALAVAPGP